LERDKAGELGRNQTVQDLQASKKESLIESLSFVTILLTHSSFVTFLEITLSNCKMAGGLH
jgi:small neutral amino acid transporter SnatA (MarC family)